MAIETDDLPDSWKTLAPPPKGGNRARSQGENVSLFMKLLPREEPYRFRLAYTPIAFRKHGWAFKSLHQWPISPASDSSQKDLDIAWKDGYYVPGEKWADFVFDRENGRLRIIEEGRDIFGPIYNHGMVTKCNPASPTKGWDWIAIVSEVEEAGPDGKKRKVRKYIVTIDTSKGATPLTDEEIKTLENPKFQRSELETRFFPKSSPEHIKELWLALPEALRKNPRRDAKGGKGVQKDSESAAPTTAPTTAPVTATTTVTAAATTIAAKPVVAASKPVVAAKVEETPPEPPAETEDTSFLNEAPTEDPSADGDDQPAARLF
jgi:hypothetical protein